MNGTFTWLEARSRWSKLRQLGQSNLVRASVLMPVFGYLLIFNEHIHQYLTIRYDDGWPFNYLPAMWRIWTLYFGTVFLAMGSILFAWCCPTAIKDYASDYMMVNAERDHLTAHNLTKQVAKTLDDLYQGMSPTERAIFPFSRAMLKPTEENLGAGTEPYLKTSDQWGLGLIHIWNVHDIKRPILRVGVFLLFRVGLILLGIPAIYTFVQVILILAKHLLTVH